MLTQRQQALKLITCSAIERRKGRHDWSQESGASACQSNAVDKLLKLAAEPWQRCLSKQQHRYPFLGAIDMLPAVELSSVYMVDLMFFG